MMCVLLRIFVGRNRTQRGVTSSFGYFHVSLSSPLDMDFWNVILVVVALSLSDDGSNDVCVFDDSV